VGSSERAKWIGLLLATLHASPLQLQTEITRTKANWPHWTGGGQSCPLAIVEYDAFVLFLQFLQAPDLLFEIVDGSPGLSADAVCQIFHDHQP